MRKESDAREFLIIILFPELRLEADQEWRRNFLIERDTNKSCKGHMKRLSSIWANSKHGQIQQRVKFFFSCKIRNQLRNLLNGKELDFYVHDAVVSCYTESNIAKMLEKRGSGIGMKRKEDEKNRINQVVARMQIF